MRVWRINRQPYTGDPLDGEGARLFGGRWNSIGVRMAYCSGSVALAALEALVHFDTDIVPNDLALSAVEIPLEVSVAALPDEALPARWREYPAAPESQAIGDQWVKRRTSAVLRVPSAIIPEESNYLINPAHQDFKGVSHTFVRRFQFDPRLFAGRSQESAW